jgi:hypothetical protein
VSGPDHLDHFTGTPSQARIRERRQDAEVLIARLSVRYEDIAATVELALEILSEDLHELYRRADDQIRRLINQAIFNALCVCDETITDAEFAEPFAALHTLHTAIRALPASAGSLAERRQRRQRCPAKTEDAGPCRDRAPFRVGSISEHLVRLVGQLSNPSSSLQAVFNAPPDEPV